MAKCESVFKSAVPFTQHLLQTLYTHHPWCSRSNNFSKLPLDHLCLRVATAAEYESWKQFFEVSLKATLLTESLVGGRPISTYELLEKDAIVVKDARWEGAPGFGVAGERSVRVIELPSPKPGSYYETGWEHAEFALCGLIKKRPVEDVPLAELEEIAMDVLKEFEKYPENLGIEYNKKSFGKGGFNIDLRWDPPAPEGWSVKFHWLPLGDVISIEQRLVI
ncbi:hypothetical protein BDR26DRAFT_1006492 [Obelidium mucronatum]|nr:hypothetical protein BDR26DRAFT_1006492 [Obelidium mucronatum]